jgi:hypothetical protein
VTQLPDVPATERLCCDNETVACAKHSRNWKTDCAFVPRGWAPVASQARGKIASAKKNTPT